MVKLEDCTGIYGIYVDDELVYIGKTTQSFSKRFQQHKYLIDHPHKSETQYIMYECLSYAREQGSHIQLKPLFIVEYTNYDSLYLINNRDIESMELFAINYFKPKYNICGITKPYKYKN